MMSPLDMLYQTNLANNNYASSIFHFDESNNDVVPNGGVPITEGHHTARSISELTTVGVNHIVAAHFIKSFQPERSNAAKLINTSNMANTPKIGNMSNITHTETITSANNTNNNTNNTNNNYNSSTSNNSSSESVKKMLGEIMNDNFTHNVNDLTNTQLNTVNDMMKKLKENKMNEIVHSDKKEG